MTVKNNIVTISERTGYSVSTVSRVLSGKAQKYRISAAAVELITREADRCHYRPNLLAQSLRTQKSQTVGLLVPGIENPFFATLSGIVISLLGARGTIRCWQTRRRVSRKKSLRCGCSRGGT